LGLAMSHSRQEKQHEVSWVISMTASVVHSSKKVANQKHCEFSGLHDSKKCATKNCKKGDFCPISEHKKLFL